MKKISIAIIFMVLAGIYFINNYMLIINISYSLPNFAFLVKKEIMPTKRGEYVAFVPPKNPYYNKNFIKIVGGLEGDKIIHKGNKVFINNDYIGNIKEYTKKGEKIEAGKEGVIPADNYFVYSKHKDSYDSRYKEIGLVNSNQIIGIAYPIF